MNVLSVEKLGKRYGPRQLFENVSFGLEKGQKTAIVARNGTGKSTLLKCIAGVEKPDSGIVTFNKGIRTGYLDQNVVMTSARSVVDEMLDRDDPVSAAIKAYEHALAQHADGRALQQAIDRMEELKAWDHEARVKALAHRFGLRDLEQAVNTLSGGQQKRLAMAKVLIDMPDVLILDEPTNHLDLTMIEQLEEELNKPGITLLLVTHDRYFLDNVCDEILEMEFGTFTRYKGNYTWYLEKKALADEVREATQQHLRGLMKRELEWVRKMPRARGTKSKSRLDKFEDIKAAATRRFDRDEVKLEVKTDRLGGKVIEARNLTKAFGSPEKPESYRPIVSHFSYSLKRGDRIGIVGPNGIGKSTFIELLVGRMRPDQGTVSIGDTVVLGTFGQLMPPFKEDQRIIEAVRDIAEVIPLNKGRTLSASQLLERFLFDKEQQYQRIDTLSGGERRRLYLCTVLMKNPNVLILDEPTNDLDIPTLNALEDFLLDLDACQLIVSHDRFFMDKLCTKLLVFKGDGVITEWVGSYTELREAEREARANEEKGKAERNKRKEQDEEAAKPVIPTGTKKLTYAERLELQRIDKEMPRLEARKAELLALMAAGGTDHHAMMAHSIELEKAIKDLDRMADRWLELSERAG
ncbi:MAG: ABC-F family ATP-binding cassette domain-containing protein [Flavobacteriales bacterium]|nr:ABC-F family ATP-binding cassette domain-containing protein [Flavobacteriales bacterium]MBK8950142.1 ABC-F family ATP-binding cassette domain-containing protein [Flavobacteriales bacterium]MBK9699424.1 ABC-F family ATP-binding cassette domain-containing protein [Flavobacteriales bacterium]